MWLLFGKPWSFSIISIHSRTASSVELNISSCELSSYKLSRKFVSIIGDKPGILDKSWTLNNYYMRNVPAISGYLLGQVLLPASGFLVGQVATLLVLIPAPGFLLGQVAILVVVLPAPGLFLGRVVNLVVVLYAQGFSSSVALATSGSLLGWVSNFVFLVYWHWFSNSVALRNLPCMIQYAYFRTELSKTI